MTVATERPFRPGLWARWSWRSVIAASAVWVESTVCSGDPLPQEPGRLCLKVAAQHGDTYLRHNGTVWSVDFSPDGTLLATAGGDGKVSVWDFRNRRKGRDIVVKEGVSAFCVRFTPQNELLVSSAAPQFGRNVTETFPAISLYSLSEGALIRQFDAPAYNCHFLRLFDHGRRVIGGGQWGWGGAISIWDVKTGRKLRTFDGRMSQVHSIAISPDESLVATGDQNSGNSARLWDMKGGKVVQVLPGAPYNNVVWAVAFSPDGKLLAYPRQQDHTVVLWDVKKSTHRALPIRQAEGINGMLFSPDSRHLYCSGLGGTILDIDAAAGTTTEVVRCGADLVDLAMSPDGRLLAAGSFGNGAWVIDLEQRQILNANPFRKVLGGRFITNRNARNPRVAALTDSQSVMVVDPANPGTPLMITNDYLRQTWSIAQVADLVVACSREGQAWAMDSRTGKQVSVFRVPERSFLAPMADGRMSAAGCDQWCIVDPEKGTILETRTFSHTSKPGPTATSAPGGAYGTRRCSGDVVELWDLEQACKVLTARIPTSFAHYELSLVSGDRNHYVVIGFPGEEKLEAHYFRLDHEDASARERAEKWIQDLGHEKHDARIQAQQHLLELGPAVLPSLTAARTSSDPEVRSRATEISATLRRVEALGKAAHDVCALARQGEPIGFGFFPDSPRWFLGTTDRLILMEANAESGTTQELASLALPKPALQLHLVGNDQFIAFNCDTSLSLYTLAGAEVGTPAKGRQPR